MLRNVMNCYGTRVPSLLRLFSQSAGADTQGTLQTPSAESHAGEVLFLSDYNFPISGVSSKFSNASQTPKKVFEHLDKRVVGQTEAKRILAIAYSRLLLIPGNRWRRRQLDPTLQAVIYPKNILMAGPTGCGKTELARTLATLSHSPFIKVEATQYTEVGYHGKDADTIIADLAARHLKKSNGQNQIKLIENMTQEVSSAHLSSVTSS